MHAPRRTALAALTAVILGCNLALPAGAVTEDDPAPSAPAQTSAPAVDEAAPEEPTAAIEPEPSAFEAPGEAAPPEKAQPTETAQPTDKAKPVDPRPEPSTPAPSEDKTPRGGHGDCRSDKSAKGHHPKPCTSSVTVKKVTKPHTKQRFGFSLDAYGQEKDFMLADGGSKSFTVAPGYVAVTEHATRGWNAAGIECSARGKHQEFRGTTAKLYVKPGEDWTCTYLNVAHKISDLRVTKDAHTSYTATYDWGIDKTTDGTGEVRLPADVDYTITVAEKGRSLTDITAAGTITITNPNAVDVSITNVTDTVSGGGTCSVDAPSTIAAGATVTAPYECTYPDGTVPRDGKNVVRVDFDKGHHRDGTVWASAPVRFSAADVTEVNKQVTVVDSRHVFDPPWTLTYGDPANTFARTYTERITADDVPSGRCQSVTNTASLRSGTGSGAAVLAVAADPTASASVDVLACNDADLTIAKTVDTSFLRTFAWDVTKTVDPTSVEILDNETATAEYTVTVMAGAYTDSEYRLTGEITVTNPNDRDVQANVTDEFAARSCDVESGTNATIPANSQRVFAYSCPLLEDYAPQPSDANTATVTWGEDESASTAPVPVTFTDPDRTANQSVTVADVWEGETENLGTVSVDDDGAIVAGDGYELVDGAAVFTYSADLEMTAGTCADFVNQAVVTGDGGAVLAEDEANTQVCAEDPLVVTKTATGSLNRIYEWGLGKYVDDTVDVLAPGQKASFTYTVKAGPNGYRDEDHALAGTITVTNPNDYKVVDASITDVASDGNWTCTPDQDVVTIDPGQSVVLDYTCALPANADMVAPTGTNHVEVTWLAGEEQRVVTYDVDYTLTVNEMYKTITLVDQFQGEDQVVLGTATWNATGTPISFTYTKEVTGTKEGYHVLKNTAMIKETGQKDTRIVDYWVRSAADPIGWSPIDPPAGRAPTLPVTGGTAGPLAAVALLGLLGGAAALTVTGRRRI